MVTHALTLVAAEIEKILNVDPEHWVRHSHSPPISRAVLTHALILSAAEVEKILNVDPGRVRPRPSTLLAVGVPLQPRGAMHVLFLSKDKNMLVT